MQNAASGSHPLHVSRCHLPLVAQAVAVLDRARQHIRNGLDAPVRMPRESREVILRIVVAESVQQKKRIELLRLAETEGALQLDARAFQCRFRLNNLLNRTE